MFQLPASVLEILRDTGITPMAHLTCECHLRQELVDVVTRYRDARIENILALGGDPPADFDLPPGELKYASELVDLIREVGDSSIGVASHPEPYPQVQALRRIAVVPRRNSQRQILQSRNSSLTRAITSTLSSHCTPSV